MKILIVEDEPRAANRLTRIIQSYSNDLQILAVIPSIKSAREWFAQNPAPDLVFLDIQLEDGNSFELVEAELISSPIIFCTAYNQFALKAFSANSIDYLLKPISKKDVFRAITKFQRFTGFQVDGSTYRNIQHSDPSAPPYRQQFLIALAGQFTPIKTNRIQAFQSYLKACKILDQDGREWLLDESLIQVEESLNPANFVRISRQWIIAIEAIERLLKKPDGYFLILHGRKLELKVSRSKVKTVKSCLT